MIREIFLTHFTPATVTTASRSLQGKPIEFKTRLYQDSIILSLYFINWYKLVARFIVFLRLGDFLVVKISTVPLFYLCSGLTNLGFSYELMLWKLQKGQVQKYNTTHYSSLLQRIVICCLHSVLSISLTTMDMLIKHNWINIFSHVNVFP